MQKVTLRKLKSVDKKYFAKWWRDKNLLKLTSGVLDMISDKEVDKYFLSMLKNADDYNYLISINKQVIGHISLAKREDGWYETQIVIGEKEYWGKGYGTKAIQVLIEKARKNGMEKIYLEVRPDNERAIKSYEKCGFEKGKIVEYPENKFLAKTLRMELR